MRTLHSLCAANTLLDTVQHQNRKFIYNTFFFEVYFFILKVSLKDTNKTFGTLTQYTRTQAGQQAQWHTTAHNVPAVKP